MYMLGAVYVDFSIGVISLCFVIYFVVFWTFILILKGRGKLTILQVLLFIYIIHRDL